MPKFGLDDILSKEDIENVAQYVMSLSDKKISNEKGKEIFKNQCAVCHNADGKGSRSVGAPNLTDAIWLYGKTKEDILYTINNSRSGVMPTWKERLDDNTIKQLAIYVHSLGGGE
jgi:cytochrome c oxidase cbb3-type subunit 3